MSLIFGISSLLFCFNIYYGWIGALLGIVAIGTSFKTIKNDNRISGIIGIVTGLIAITIGTFLCVGRATIYPDKITGIGTSETNICISSLFKSTETSLKEIEKKYASLESEITEKINTLSSKNDDNRQNVLTELANLNLLTSANASRFKEFKKSIEENKENNIVTYAVSLIDKPFNKGDNALINYQESLLAKKENPDVTEKELKKIDKELIFRNLNHERFLLLYLSKELKNIQKKKY